MTHFRYLDFISIGLKWCTTGNKILESDNQKQTDLRIHPLFFIYIDKYPIFRFRVPPKHTFVIRLIMKYYWSSLEPCEIIYLGLIRGCNYIDKVHIETNVPFKVYHIKRISMKRIRPNFQSCQLIIKAPNTKAIQLPATQFLNIIIYLSDRSWKKTLCV